MRMRSFAALLSMAVLWCLALTTARAECNIPWFVTTSYCDGCQYDGTITLNRNETCERAFQQPGARGPAGDVLYLASRIIQRARHGIAGASGNVVAYRPAKDYVGTDDFVMKMTFNQYGKLGKFTTHYAVTVK